MEDCGYEVERFDQGLTDQFICPICTQVVKQPFECVECGALFCNKCIQDWTRRKNECPRSRCDLKKSPVRPVAGALLRIYNNLDIRCRFFDKCSKTCKLSDLESHEDKCQLEKCKNFDICESSVNPKGPFAKDKVCTAECLLLGQIRNTNGNWKQGLECIKKCFKELNLQQHQGNQQNFNQSGIPGDQIQIALNYGNNNGITSFKWDRFCMGQGIELSANGKDVFLKEQQYMFRSIIADTPFMSGCHYWEIHADPRTENELKIGVACKKDFNYNSAFCDYEYGFAYYGLGQLRSGSNAAGSQYGKRFKKQGVLGVYLDMNKGTVSFGLDGEFWGVGFSNAIFKKGPIYAAVSLLHCAGCKLVNNKPAPANFQK